MEARCRTRVMVYSALLVLGAVLGASRCLAGRALGSRDGGVAPGAPGMDPEALAARSGARPTASSWLLAPLREADRVVSVTLRGRLDAAAARKLQGALRGLTERDALQITLDVAGGELAPTLASLERLRATRAFVLALVDKKALGLAAALPLVAQAVYVQRDAKWGAVSPQAFDTVALGVKQRARLREVLRTAALKARRPVDAVLAMVSPAGKLATYTARRATRLGLADGLYRTYADLLRRHAPAPKARPAAADAMGPASPAARPAAGSATAQPAPPPPKPRIDPKALVKGATRIVRITIHGTIELGLKSFVLRVIRDARAGDVVVLDIDTFGGRVDAATQMRDALMRTKAKTIALINPRAISAGALISLACDLIVMVPGGSFGAATPIQVGGGGQAKPVGEKYVSYMRKEFKSTAMAKGRRGDIAEAMVDMSVEVKDVPEALKESISGLQKGKLLTLTTDEAIQLRMAEMRAQGFDDMVQKLGLSKLPVIKPSVNWAEDIARFLTGPVVSGLLMTIGVLGLLLELYTPGFGVSGAVGVSCLLLFFFGHRIAGLAGWEPMLIFVLGVGLLGVEIFITPGFGLLGSLGVLAVVGSLFWTLLGPGGIPLEVSWEVGYVSHALVRVFIAVIVGAVLLVLALRFIPRGAGPFRRLVLSATVDGDATAGAHALPGDAQSLQDLVGRTGRAETGLRPTGKARISGKRLEVQSRGPYIEKGARVQVVAVEGRRIEVKAAPAEPTEEDA